LGAGSPATPGAQNFQPSQWQTPGFNPNNQFQPQWQSWQNQWGNDWYDDEFDGFQPGFNPYWRQQQQQQGWQFQPPVTWSNEPIEITMPEGEPGVCAYTLSSGVGGWNYTITPGKSQAFREDRPWSVTFDRGDGRGVQTYKLKPGRYRFRHGENGWDLFRQEM
jgi:hypothetical protein